MRRDDSAHVRPVGGSKSQRALDRFDLLQMSLLMTLHTIHELPHRHRAVLGMIAAAHQLIFRQPLDECDVHAPQRT